MKLSFFRTLSVRSKIMTVAILGLLLAGTSIFTVLYSTGKLGTKASTIVKTVTFSGTVTDSMTQKPISGATITSGYIGGPPSQTTTDAKGNYKISITVDATKPDQQLAGVQVSKSGYASGENTSAEIVVPDSSTTPTNPIGQGSPNTFFASTTGKTSASMPVSQNFSLVNTNTLIGQATTASVTPKIDTNNPCGWSNFYSENIQGVVFCTTNDNKAKFISSRANIIKNAQQANFIKSQVGLSYLPKIYITDKLTSTTPVNGFKSFDGDFDSTGGFKSDPKIDIVYSTLNTTETLTHEMGHFVDYYRGYDVSGTIKFNPACDYVSDKKSRCRSSANKDFGYAFQIAKNSAVMGYAVTNRFEMFAEFFTGIMYEDRDPATPLDNFKNVVENYMLLETNTFYLTDLSRVVNYPQAGKTTVEPKYHNALMYLYKFVAKQSQMNQVFPGDIGRWDYPTIRDGKYMKVGVESVKVVDHSGKLMSSTSVVFAGKTQITREHQEQLTSESTLPLDPDGSFVYLNTPVGSQKTFDIPTAPDYYKGAIYNPIKKDIIQGSNPVVKLNYSPLTFTITGVPTIGTKGNLFFPPTGRTAYSIAKGQMTRYPDFGTKNGAVDTISFGRGSLVMMVGGDVQTGSGSTMKVTSTFTGSGTYIAAPYPGPAMTLISITSGKICTMNNAKYPITWSCK